MTYQQKEEPVTTWEMPTCSLETSKLQQNFTSEMQICSHQCHFLTQLLTYTDLFIMLIEVIV